MGTLSNIDISRVPGLIAQFLPVEICIYYQVVPISTDYESLVLGMVDIEDLAALDYVGKLLGYSELKIQPQPLTIEEHQELIAYYFSHPPAEAELTAIRQQAEATRLSRAHPIPQEPQAESEAPAAVPLPPRPAAASDSDETVQQLLNSMLRRALDDKADQIYIEPVEPNLCRIRYRQQGIIRDLFKELTDNIRAKLMINLKKMVGLDSRLIGERQQGDVERVYRGEPLIIQMSVIPQRNKEAAKLVILRGESLVKYQQEQNNARVVEALLAAQQAHELFQKFESTMASLLDKVRHYSGHPNGDWQALSSMLDVLKTNAETLAAYQQEWNELLRNAGQHSR
ncbi:MAG: hypothetical protein Q6J68_03825 [Thermostichales cyanobacterium SZTDM-1c_bins_54]